MNRLYYIAFYIPIVFVAAFLSCAGIPTASKLKADFAAHENIGPETELAASPQLLYKRGIYLREKGAYNEALKDFDSDSLKALPEGKNGIFVKCEKALTLLQIIEDDIGGLSMGESCNMAETERAILKLSEVKDLLTNSLEEAPKDNKKANDTYKRVELLESKLNSIANRCRTSASEPVHKKFGKRAGRG